jgi:hypothetical protein
VRSSVVVIGVVLAVVGFALWYAPLEDVSKGTVEIVKPTYVVGVQVPLDVLGGGLDYEISWHSSSSESLRVYDCGTDSNCADATHAPQVAQASGNSVQFKFAAKSGRYYDLVFSALPISPTISYVEPVLGGTLGLASTLVGVIVAIVGGTMPPAPPRRMESTETESKDD